MSIASSRCYGAAAGSIYPSLQPTRWSPAMTKPKTKTVNDFSRCLDPLDMDATLIALLGQRGRFEVMDVEADHAPLK
jgi:hypothetical protein